MGPTTTESAIERFQIGFTYAIPVVGVLYERVTKILKP